MGLVTAFAFHTLRNLSIQKDGVSHVEVGVTGDIGVDSFKMHTCNYIFIKDN